MRRSRILLALTTAATLVSAPLAATSAASAASAAPTTFYVDCSRSGAGGGTASAPWHALSAVNTHGAFTPGDRILLRRGTVCRGKAAPSGSGTAIAPIVLGAYGSGAKPRVVGGGTGDRTGAVMLTNQQFWTIQDLDISNSSKAKTTSRYRSGVLIQNRWARKLLHGITLQRLTVHAVTSNMGHKKGDPREWGGISVLTSGRPGDGFSGVRVLKNRVDHVGRTGVIVSNRTYPHGGDVAPRVSGNRISWTRGDGLVVRGSRDARVDHNVVAHAANEWPCPQCGRISPHTANAGIWVARSNRTRIDHNEAYGTKRLGGDGEGFDLDSSSVNATFEYNYAHDNEGGGILFCGSRNAVVRFNIFENNRRAAFTFIGDYPTRNTQIYNNTVYASARTGARPVRYFNGARGSRITFRNNIVYNYGKSTWFWPTRPKTSANTLVGSNGKGRPADAMTSFRTPALKNPGTGKNGFKSLNGYRPRHPSSFQRGVAIPKSITRDFFGKRINPKKPPRGAAG